MLLVVI